MGIIQSLEWRYATKRMNGQKVPQDKIQTILEAIRLTASSTGLQPYNVLLVEDEKTIKELQPIANNQLQVPDASHILIFAAWTTMTEERAQAVKESIEKARGSVSDVALRYLESAKSRSINDPAGFFNWTARQTYIALGTALAVAAEERVDTTPMEGFNNQLLDEYFHLEEKGLKSVLILALGYRDETNDWLLKLPKARRPLDNLIIKV